jgi:hypothetical protein
VILDDLETDPYKKYEKNKKEAADPEIVRQILDWVKLEVLPSLEAGGNLLILGTILRWQSALHLMVTGNEEPFRHFRRRIYRAVQEDGNSLWEARYPTERLKLQKRFLGRVAFNREKMNEPLPEAGLFREEWIHYYHPDILKPAAPGGRLFRAISGDRGWRRLPGSGHRGLGPAATDLLRHGRLHPPGHSGGGPAEHLPAPPPLSL